MMHGFEIASQHVVEPRSAVVKTLQPRLHGADFQWNCNIFIYTSLVMKSLTS